MLYCTILLVFPLGSINCRSALFSGGRRAVTSGSLKSNIASLYSNHSVSDVACGAMAL